MKTLLQLIIGYICGFLMIKWFPITFPLNTSEIFVSFIFNPLEFFVACIMFIVGIIVNGNLIKQLLVTVIGAVKKRYVPSFEQTLSIFVFIIYLFLLKEGFWQTLVLICFSFLYGISSLEYRKEKTF